MEFPVDYFEDEVRDGFYVPSMVKRAWAAQIESLREVTEICERHGIRFFADWGTMLGAVRHGGYIPWDDDLDILMLRKDYNKFLEIAPKELPSHYQINNIYNMRDYDNVLTRLNTSPGLGLDEEFLSKYHQFPCSTGLDIFVVDYLPRDPKTQAQLAEALTLIYSLKYQIEDVPEDEREEYIAPLEDSLGIKIDRKGDLMHQFGLWFEKIASMYTEKESDVITCMTLWSGNSSFGYPKDAFEKRIKIPFENFEIPVAAGYDRLLRKKYGNYMKQVRDHTSHNYPYFASQYEAFEKKIDKKKYIPNGVHKRRFQDGRKEFLTNQCVELMSLMEEVSALIEDAKNKGDNELLLQLNKQAGIISENASIVLDSLENRHEIDVFLPVKAEWWAGMAPIWNEVANSRDKEAIVVPLVFYEKNVFGYDTAGFYDINRFPKETCPIDSSKIDLVQLHPDKIYIQIPFDQYNDGFRVQEEYYCEKLRDICDQLIYVPYFIQDDVTSDDRRALMHLHCQCDTPGFAYSDQIYVQSEEMKEAYLNETVSFFGEEYRSILEEKMIVSKLPIESFDKEAICRAELPSSYNEKKHLCFHMGIASFLDNKEAAIDKLKEVIDIYEESKDKTSVHWILDRNEVEAIREFAPRIASMLSEQIDIFLEKELGTVSELEDRKKIAYVMGAYYGDSSFIADIFSANKKPVMVMNI